MNNARFNVFSGARRIAALIAIFILAVQSLRVFNYDASVTLFFDVEHPKAPWVRVSNCDSSVFHRVSESVSVSSSIEALVYLCLRKHPLGERDELMVPVEIDAKGIVWGARRGSDELQRYERAMLAKISLSPSEVEEVKRRGAEKRAEKAKEEFSITAVILVMLAALTWAVGWVMRGFLGIPRGKDHRSFDPDAADKKP